MCACGLFGVYKDCKCVYMCQNCIVTLVLYMIYSVSFPLYCYYVFVRFMHDNI